MCNGSALVQGEPHIVDNTGRHALPLSTESFEDIVERHVYVDKTLLARDLIDRGGVTLYCRPRRFGKSTALRMLQSFFQLPVEGCVRDSRELFHNLSVWEQGERYQRECGAHPVIYLSLGGCARQSLDATLARMAREVSREYLVHRYLLESNALLSFERERFERIAARAASQAELEGSLADLADLLVRYHGSKVVILIDEYDTPIRDGYTHGYRREILDFYRSWLTDALKGTTSLWCAALTGILRVSQESIFSELNNVIVNTTLDEEFSEAFGFTEDEAEALAVYMGRKKDIPLMRRWYDGYHFGKTNAYNPWSVLHFLNRGEAQPYWTNTSNNDIVSNLVMRADEETTVELASLASGDVVCRGLDLRTVFDDLDNNPEAVWAQLYQSGYVTTKDTGMANDRKKVRKLTVPNLEIGELYGAELMDRSVRMAGSRSRLDALHRALLAADPEAFATALRRVLLDTPSYHDLTDERAYHTLLLGLLYAIPGYSPATSNRESGDGRCDVLLEPLPERARELPAMAMELKYVSIPSDGKELAAKLERIARDDALDQAVRLEYGHGLAGKGLIHWGIAFAGKHVAVVSE